MLDIRYELLEHILDLKNEFLQWTLQWELLKQKKTQRSNLQAHLLDWKKTAFYIDKYINFFNIEQQLEQIRTIKKLIKIEVKKSPNCYNKNFYKFLAFSKLVVDKH